MTDIAVRPGFYLEDHPPKRARGQFRVGRRAKVKPVIVVHTAESGTDLEGPDLKAENVARFIRTRSNAGSYHLIGDADSIIQLVDFGNEAYGDGTGSNPWAIHISLAMNAADWPTLTPARRDEFIDSAARMAMIAGDWLITQGLERPAAQWLTKAESDMTNATGFISHARRDPTRRSDPGKHFPWPEFLIRYKQLMDAVTHNETDIRAAQTMLTDLGYDPGPVDGIIGPRTTSAAIAYTITQGTLNGQVVHQTVHAETNARKAALWDAVTELVTGELNQ